MLGLFSYQLYLCILATPVGIPPVPLCTQHNFHVSANTISTCVYDISLGIFHRQQICRRAPW